MASDDVSDGPLASAMKDSQQDGRHAHFGHEDGEGYDSSNAAHRHAMEYDEVRDHALQDIWTSAWTCWVIAVNRTLC